MSTFSNSEDPDEMPQNVASGADPGFLERGFLCLKVWGFALLFYLIFLICPMKMK